MRVAFLGLGVMGYPMAGHLATAGHDVCVYNRSEEKRERWLSEYEGQFAITPSAAVVGAEVVLMCLGNDEDVRSVVFGPQGVFDGMDRGAILVDHTTASLALAEALAEAASSHKLGFVDAPVSGGQAGAEQGQLTVMAGGSEADFERVAPVVNCYAKRLMRMGEVGSGQLTKMVNQICIAGLIQGLAEGVHFAQQSALDLDKVFDVIGQGAAQSWQMDNRAKSMAEDSFEFGFAVDWMRKDLSIVLAQARDNGATLPVAALVDQFYADVQAMGGGRWDTSSLLRRLTHRGSGQ